MKLCPKCEKDIRVAATVSVNIDDPNNPAFIWNLDPHDESRAPFKRVSEAECEFYLHKTLNSVLELVKWCRNCKQPAHSNQVRCTKCGSINQWSGQPL